MRKLLLATVAAMGASMAVATIADAQTAAPAPGTITVRLNGRVRFYAGFFDDQDLNPTPRNTGSATFAANGNKQSHFGFGDYARLFPGFDGVAANGLKYGASLEIRQDNATPPGGGVNGSISAADRGRGTLYFRREWGYLGTDQLGQIRLGSTDQPSSLYMTGNFESFNDGGWNGDVPALLAGNAQLVWPFADVGGVYTTTKVVYLSPQFLGFDFGISYAPNTGNVNINGGNCSVASGAAGSAGVNGAIYGGGAGVGCDRLSATPGGDYARPRNIIDALIRYRGTFGPIGVAATAGFIGSGKVSDNATPARGVQYDGLRVGDFGVAVTYGGFQVGGKFQYGRVNNTGGFGLSPTGGSDETAFLVGAQYTVGPLVVGAHYVDVTSAGVTDLNPLVGQRREQGFAAGGTYSLAPGVSIFASYLWTQRKENGFNFITGTEWNGLSGAASNGGNLTNKIRAQAFAIGTSFSW